MRLKGCEFLVFIFFVYFFFLETTQATCVVKENFSPHFNVCTDGTVIRGTFLKIIPPHVNLTTNVQSKDVVYSLQINQSVRIFLPDADITKLQGKKFPLIVYYHGGAFTVGDFANPPFHNLVTQLTANAKVIAVSVDYRRAPEHPLPVAFDDSWTALQWIASHANGGGSEEWLNLYVDFDKVIVLGDSAGATLAINMALRNGQKQLEGVNLIGTILQMPYFVNLKGNLSEWETRYFKLIYPSAFGTDNSLINPADDPDLGMVGSPRVLVIVGELDPLIAMQRQFFEKLVKSSWEGKGKILEIKGEGHMFNLDPNKIEKGKAFNKRIADIIKSWNA